MIVINNDKAITLVKEKLREWRKEEFKKNDLALQNAFVDGIDTKALIERRDYLRNITNEADGKSIEELKAILVERGIE